MRPVMLAHLLTKRFRFHRDPEYNNCAVPVGGTEAASLFYQYAHVYVDKIVADLKRIGLWDSSGQRKWERAGGGRQEQ